MTKEFRLEERQWYGWIEVPVEEPGFAASPIFVMGVKPLKTGAGYLGLEFLQPLFPGGGTRRTLALKVLQHSSGHLTCRFKDSGRERTAIVAPATFEWMASYCQEHIRRRPVKNCSWLIEGEPTFAPEPSDYFSQIFGSTHELILYGAKPDSFPVGRHQMPENTDSFLLDASYSAFDSLLISRGFVPHEMEEKWFVYLTGGHLVFRRSWTGIPIYEVEVSWRGNTLYLGWARVNRDPEQYGETDTSYDQTLLLYLIEVVLLGKPEEFPVKRGSEDTAPLQAWSVAGSASLT